MNEVDINILRDSGVGQDDLLAELQAIKQNTSETTINAGDIELHVDGLEALITLTNGKLDHLSSDVDSVNSNLGNIFSRQDDILTASNATKLTNDTIATKTSALTTANHTDLVAINSRQDDVLTACNATKLSVATVATKITSLDNTNHTDLGNIFSRQDDILTASNATKLSVASMDTDLSAHKTSNNTNLVNIFSRQDDILTATNAVKTNTQSVENCVSSNKLNVNISSGIGDLATESTLQTIAEFNCDTTDVTISSSALPSGAATQATLSAAEVHLGNVETKLTSLDLRLAAEAVLLSAILAKNGEIETSADALIAANHTDLVALEASADALIAANHTDLVALEASLTSMESKMDADNVVYDNQLTKLTEIDTVLDNSKTTLDASLGKQTTLNSLIVTLDTVQDNALTKLGEIETSADALIAANHTDLVALEASLSAMEGKQDTQITHLSNTATDLAAIEVLLTAANVDHAANEVLLGTIDADTNAIKDSTAACATDLAALEVLSTAANVDLAALEVLATAANVDHAANEVLLTTVAAKATLQTTSEVKEILSAATINSGAQSAQIDTENYEKVRFFGESTASVGTDIVLMGSNADGGTFYIIGENLRGETIGSTHYVYGADIENLPRYIKLLNKSGSTNYIFTKLYMQGSGGRVAV